MMQVQVATPTSLIVNQACTKVIAEGAHGCFGILPRHIDYLALLVPGILILSDESGQETFLAVDEGILIKHGSDVHISVRRAIRGDDLVSLKTTVHQRFVQLDEADRNCQTAIASLEANFLRQFLEMQKAIT
ncbi:MAG: F0F1 ATP synthase subunit epsilon [Planctomycetota bacterium]